MGEHSVCGIWQAARLAGRLHHSRAHDFFARARWSSDQLGLLLLDFLVERFVDEDAPIRLAVDGTVFGRSGRKVFGAFWHHDSSAAPRGGFRFGNCFVVLGLVVRIGALGERAWCLPVLFRLWVPTPKPTRDDPEPKRRPSQQDLAAQLATAVGERYPERLVALVGDSASACKATAGLPANATLISRLRANAVLHGPTPPPTGRRGRPRLKGERLGSPKEIAERAKPGERQRVEVPGRGEALALIVDGLWHSVFGPAAVRVVVVREPADTEGHRIALRSPSKTPSRPSGSARRATVCRLRCSAPCPSAFLCQSIAVAHHALCGEPAEDVARRRLAAPWHRTKRDPSTADVMASLRREPIRAEFQAGAGRGRRKREIRRAALPCGRAAA